MVKVLKTTYRRLSEVTVTNVFFGSEVPV